MSLTTISLLLLVTCSLGGQDVEDLISRGYTCSLADLRAENEVSRKPGVEIVCDDGVCSQCVKTGDMDSIKPWLVRHKDMDPEDYLRHGYVCSEEFRDHGDADRVCDDGHCVGCKKPRWSGVRGDVEHYLERGYRCFLVRDVPQYALSSDVEVVCEDGDCFGCIHRQGGDRESYRRKRPLTLEDMMSQGYTCVLTHQRDSGVVCEDGKCFQCSPPGGQELEYPVTVKFLDRAEDFVDDHKRQDCGLFLRKNSDDDDVCHEGKGSGFCDGDLCVRCCPEISIKNGGDMKTLLREHVLEKVEDLAKSGRQCFVKFSKNIKESPGDVVECSTGVCFVCRR